MSASLTDLLTAAKNIVTALNQSSQTILAINGTSSQTNITSATLVTTGQGRLVTISVIITNLTGATAGTIYDATAAASTSNPVGVIPVVSGVYVWNIPYNNGIVVAPGTNQTVTVVYS
jgi:hypothetical protein